MFWSLQQTNVFTFGACSKSEKISFEFFRSSCKTKNLVLKLASEKIPNHGITTVKIFHRLQKMSFSDMRHAPKVENLFFVAGSKTEGFTVQEFDLVYSSNLYKAMD